LLPQVRDAVDPGLSRHVLLKFCFYLRYCSSFTRQIIDNRARSFNESGHRNVVKFVTKDVKETGTV
jgi:hypothetical protein